MNTLIKSGFLNQIFHPENSVIVDYDFRNVSYTGIVISSTNTGYLVFNNATGIGYQYSGSNIYDSYHPALSVSDAGQISKSVISGNFNGDTKLKILGNIDSTNWTIFTTFNHLETGFSAVSKVIFSSQSGESAVSGLTFGLNGCNKLFCEHNTPSSGKRIYTVNQDLDNKNLISLSKMESNLFIGIHQFNNSLNKKSTDSRFELLDFAPFNTFYIGGIKASGSNYRNFSGYIDSFMILDRGMQFPERNTFAKAFFCSGFAPSRYEDEVTSLISVAGLEFQNIPVFTGITGYVTVLAGTETVNGGVVNRYTYSGVTGILYESKIVEVMGTSTGTSTSTFFHEASGLIDYGYAASFGNSKILLLNDFDSSYKEVYSFSGVNNDDINLIPNFSEDNLSYAIFSTGSGEWVNLYINGISEPLVTGFSSQMSGDFVISDNYITSESFFDRFDSPVYDIISGSGSFTGITTTDVANGSKSFSGSYINNRDLYLNGMKLISGIDYSGVGSLVTLSTSNLIDGDILILPKHNQNLSRYTGFNDNNFDTNLNLFDEQVWVNGLRQVKEVDYQKLSNFNLNYSTVSLEPSPDIIYDNETGHFKIKPNVVRNGLIISVDAGDLESYPGSGTGFYNLAQNKLHGQFKSHSNAGPVAGPIFSGVNGGSLLFDGYNSWVDFGPGSGILPMSNFSVEYWFKCLGHSPLQTTSALGSITYDIVIRIESNGAFKYGQNGQTVYLDTPTSYNYKDSLWHQSVFVTTPTNRKIYVDGAYITGDAQTWTGIRSQYSGIAIALGWNVNDNAGYHFSGHLPIMRIYNKELSASEVLQNFNALKPRFPN